MRQANCQHLTYFTLAFVLVACPSSAGNKQNKVSAAESLENYIERTRVGAASAPTPGSLWVPQGSFANLASDDKARNINDTIIINVVEETTAAADASVKSARTFSASSGISELAGVIGARSGLQNIFSPQSSQTLNGQAQTASDSKFSATLAGQVVRVLPNGYLVVEAVRQIEMNNQRQTLVVRGIVRPSDIASDNSVLSSQLGNLEVELAGKGVLSDGVRPPNKIVRALLKLVGF